MSAPATPGEAEARMAALRARIEEVLAETRVFGFLRLQPGLTPAELDRAEAVVLAAFADYRKGETGRTSSGFYLVRG